ncbi:hypothetical protein ACQWJY_22130, partial [Salmonella enterica subsp. enterica serovar Infantis]
MGAGEVKTKNAPRTTQKNKRPNKEGKRKTNPKHTHKTPKIKQPKKKTDQNKNQNNQQNPNPPQKTLGGRCDCLNKK